MLKHLKNRIKNKVIYTSFKTYDHLFYSKKRIFSLKEVQSNDTRKISVVITYYNRDNTIHKALYNVINDSRVSEVLIVDDGSKPDSIAYLDAFVAKLNNPKIKISKNVKNLGMYPNKIHSFSLAKNDWVILLDSDNTLKKKYIDAIFNIPNWDIHTMYCPAFGWPLLDNRVLSGNYTFAQMKDLLNAHSDKAEMFLNSGNFFVNKNEFMGKIQPYLNTKPSAADSSFINYMWLSQGNMLSIVKECVYVHRLNADSTWKLQSEESIIKFNKIKEAINNLDTSLDFIQ